MRLRSLVTAALVGAPSLLAAQDIRFLVQRDSASPPVRLDPARVWSLSQRIAGHADSLAVADAIRRVAQAAGVSIVYESRLIDGLGPRVLGADSLTVAAALQALLGTAAVDVIIRSSTSFVLLPRTTGPVTPASGPNAPYMGRGRGSVRDTVSGRPVAGAVVLAFDSASVMIGRTLTTERGQFLLETSAPVAALRVQRLGFRMRELRGREIGNGASPVAVALVPLPSMLEPVLARAAAACPVRADNAAAMSLLEQARSGLLATIVAREWAGARFSVLGYARRYMRKSDRILWQKVWSDSSGEKGLAFKAGRTPAQFIASGFMESTPQGKAFFGPDAEVLLDAAFSEAYCFGIAKAEKDRAGQVGLTFAPVHVIAGRLDIDGTLWIDTVARALRDIDFDYVGIGKFPASVRPRGSTSFRSLPNGAVVVDRWMIRLPGLQQDTVYAFFNTQKVAEQSFYVTENGGHLVSAEWPDGIRYRAELGSLRVVASVRRDSAPIKSVRNPSRADFVPAAGVWFRLANTDYHGVTDANGRAEIANLLPGPYSLQLDDPTLSLFEVHVPPLLEFVIEGTAPLERKLDLPTTHDAIYAGCQRQGAGVPEKPAVYLLGKVLDGAGKPLRDTYLEFRNELGAKPFLKSTTGPTGQFYLCLPEAMKTESISIGIAAQAPDGRKQQRMVRLGLGLTTVQIVFADSSSLRP